MLKKYIKNNKRGLSGVVTALIMILLVLVAIGIVWVVIRNLIISSTEEISLGVLTVDLQIKSVQTDPASGDTIIRVKRNVGEGNLSGIKFIVSDGSNTATIEKTTSMGELSEKEFNFTKSELSGIAFVKDVSIAPVLMTDSGKKKIGRAVSELSLSNKDVLANLGAVSWWKLDGNANDEIGSNHGQLMGGVDCSVSGYNGNGKACDFKNKGNISIPNLGYPILTNDTTISFWIKLYDYANPNRQNPFNQAFGGWGTMTLETTGSISWYFGSNGGDGQPNSGYPSGSGTITNSQWIHIVAVRDSSNYSYKFYKNGNFLTGGNYDPSYPKILTRTFTIGDGYMNSINGTIDEVMIFNKALTAEEIQGIYNMDLS